MAWTSSTRQCQEFPRYFSIHTSAWSRTATNSISSNHPVRLLAPRVKQICSNHISRLAIVGLCPITQAIYVTSCIRISFYRFVRHWWHAYGDQTGEWFPCKGTETGNNEAADSDMIRRKLLTLMHRLLESLRATSSRCGASVAQPSRAAVCTSA